MATIIQHGDFTFNDEKIEEIAKNIEVVNNKKAFWGAFCTKDATNVGDKLVLRRQVLLDPASVATLNEGGTPRLDQIKVTSYEITTQSFGSYIKYSRQAYKKNRDSIPDMGRRQLAHNRMYDIESVRSTAYLGATNSISLGDTADKWWQMFTTGAIRLRKNHAKPDGASFIAIVTPECAKSIAEESMTKFGTALAGTNKSVEAVEKGFIGTYGGFDIYQYAGDEMYSNSNANGYVLLVGKTEDGKFPVVSRFADEGNIEVISKEIGSAGAADPTNEYGTIAARIDDIAAGLEHPECVLKANVTLDAFVSDDIPAEYSLTSSNDVTTPAEDSSDSSNDDTTSV